MNMKEDTSSMQSICMIPVCASVSFLETRSTTREFLFSTASTVKNEDLQCKDFYCPFTKNIGLLIFEARIVFAMLTAIRTLLFKKSTFLTKAIKDFKDSNKNTIVVAAGDLYQGPAISNLNEGAPINEMMNNMKYYNNNVY